MGIWQTPHTLLSDNEYITVLQIDRKYHIFKSNHPELNQCIVNYYVSNDYFDAELLLEHLKPNPGISDIILDIEKEKYDQVYSQVEKQLGVSRLLPYYVNVDNLILNKWYKDVYTAVRSDFMSEAKRTTKDILGNEVDLIGSLSEYLKPIIQAAKKQSDQKQFKILSHFLEAKLSDRAFTQSRQLNQSTEIDFRNDYLIEEICNAFDPEDTIENQTSLLMAWKHNFVFSFGIRQEPRKQERFSNPIKYMLDRKYQIIENQIKQLQDQATKTDFQSNTPSVKIQWNGQANALAHMFRELTLIHNNKGPLIENSLYDLARFLKAHFTCFERPSIDTIYQLLKDKTGPKKREHKIEIIIKN